MVAKSRPWKCNFLGCNEAFRTEEKLKEHKIYSDQHEYCQHCDMNFEEYDDLTEHKVELAKAEIQAIRAWEKRETIRHYRELQKVGLNLDEERELDPKPEIMHLCCKYCGQDFQSLSGRDLHISRNHPVEQELYCTCGKVFYRASQFVHHLENGLCSKISAKQFRGLVQQKRMIKDLLQDPETIMEIANTSYFDPGQEDDGGGVALNRIDLFEHPSSDDKLQEALVPVKQESVRNVGFDEKFPKLPSQAQTLPKDYQLELEREMENLKIQYQKEGRAAFNPVGKALKLDVTGPPTAKLAEVADLTNRKDSEPEKSSSSTTGRTNGGKLPADAWQSKAGAAKALFPDAKPTPKDPNYTAPTPEKTTNLLYSHAWNPGSYDYNPEHFFNPVIEMYRCPVHACQRTFKRPAELTEHIEWAHRAEDISCPTCFKVFQSYSALVAHCESATAKCRITQSDDYGKSMHGFTGGLLSADLVQRPDMSHRDDGSVPNYIRFETNDPQGPEEEPKVVKINARW